VPGERLHVMQQQPGAPRLEVARDGLDDRVVVGVRNDAARHPIEHAGGVGRDRVEHRRADRDAKARGGEDQCVDRDGASEIEGDQRAERRADDDSGAREPLDLGAQRGGHRWDRRLVGCLQHAAAEHARDGLPDEPRAPGPADHRVRDANRGCQAADPPLSACQARRRRRAPGR
jgi:hypothetical protein